MRINLLNTQLFSDIKEKDMEHLIHCLNPIEKEYKKGNTILYEGEYTESLGVLLSGMVIIEYCDAWGNNNILGNVLPGAVFAEVYSCIPRQKLLVSVVAAEDSKVMFININRLLHTCGNSCLFHTKLIKNLLEICASKNIQLSQRILHTTSKSIRGRLMSYFSECIKNMIAILSTFLTIVNNLLIIWVLIEVLCVMNYQKCRRKKLYYIRKIILLLMMDSLRYELNLKYILFI